MDSHVKGRAGQDGHTPSLAGNDDGRSSLCEELGEANLHLRNLVAIVVCSPCLPIDTICIALMGTPEVEAIQVGTVTIRVPPGSTKC